MIHCPMCGYDFPEEWAHAGCRGCPLRKGCGQALCPRCGYHVVPEPAWFKRLKDWRQRHAGKAT